MVVFTDAEKGHRSEDVVEEVVRDRWEAARRLEVEIRVVTLGSTALAEAASQPSETEADLAATGDASSAG